VFSGMNTYEYVARVSVEDDRSRISICTIQINLGGDSAVGTSVVVFQFKVAVAELAAQHFWKGPCSF